MALPKPILQPGFSSAHLFHPYIHSLCIPECSSFKESSDTGLVVLMDQRLLRSGLREQVEGLFETYITRSWWEHFCLYSLRKRKQALSWNCCECRVRISIQIPTTITGISKDEGSFSQALSEDSESIPLFFGIIHIVLTQCIVTQCIDIVLTQR